MKTTKSIFSKNTIRGGVFACIAILAASLIFSSCDNFLKANDVSQEIKEAIAYNNAEACTIVLKADPEMGEFLTGNQITAREGFSSQFQFSLNQDNYIFEEFQALCNSDSTISRADCVEFTEVKKDSKGIYKVTFKLIKKADDIVIRPKCIALPKITEITPKSESGSCDQDTPIKISFNKPVNPDSFFDSTVTAENRTIKNFKGISIYFDEEDLLEHFETPYFSSDNKTLYIPINQDKLILPPDESKNFLNIKVAYNFEEATDCEGYAINQSGIHEYKINKNFGNQKKVMVNIHSEEKYGTILSGSEKECTVGYTIEIQYKPNLEDYKFTGFEAVSIKNNSESRASAVTFEKALLEEQTGFYSVRVRVVEEADDLLLLPVCYEYPKILSYSPDSSHENYANTPIQVNFSIPMEAADTTEENSVFNYDNILLTANGNSVVKYFETPVFDSEKKVLTLPLKGRGLADYLNDTHLSTVTINVTFTERILITKNDVSVGLKNNGKTSFAVLYNKIVETVPPEKLAFEVTSQKINLQNAQEVLNAKKKVVLADKTTLASSTEEVFIDNKFTDKDVATGEGIIQSEYDKAVWQNITTGTVYIYGSYSDTGSGVKSVSVTEQFTYYSDGDPEGSSSDSVTTEYTEKSDNAVFETNNGITKFCIEYKIKEWNDGAISLKVLVKDACGNCSKQEKRDAIKVSRVAGVSISNGSGRGNQSTEYLDFSSKPYYFNTTEHKEAIKKITCQVYDDSDIRASRIFREVIFPVDSYSITCEYDGLQEPVLLEDPEVTKYGWGVTCDWVHELEVESVEGLSVKFTIKDVLGNVLETEKKYPVSDVKINLFKHTNGNICFVLTDSSNKKIGSSSGYFFVAKKGSNEYCWPYDASSEYNNILKSGYEYRIYNSQLGFYGPILNENDPFSCGDYEEPTLRELTVKRKYIEKGTQDGYVVRVVELNDSWKDYDFIYAVRVNGDNQPFDFKDGVLKKAYKADACFAPKYEPGTTDYINSSARIKVYGVKDNIRSPEYEWELPYITDEQKIDYDDIPATIGISNVRNDYLKFSVSDSLSGPLFGKISVPDNVYSEVKTTEAEPFEILLPVWEYMPMSGILYSIAYEVKDKSETGNKKEGLYSSSQFIPIININLLKINTDGSLVIDVDNLYPQYDNPPCEFFVSKLG